MLEEEIDINTDREIKICHTNEMGTGEQQVTKVRDERIDAVKYWLIVLVIAGHVLKRSEFADSTACRVLWNWIYIFHMPLFVFISGYFSRKKAQKDFWPSNWKILEPLIIFQFLRKMPFILLNGTENLLKTIFTPGWVLWYLLSLIYWRLMLHNIPDKILKHAKLFLLGISCISIMAGFLPFNRFLSLQRTLAFMPFFFLGYYMSGKKLYLPNKYKSLCIIFLIMMFSIPLFFPQYLGNLTHDVPYKNAHEAISRMVVFILSIPMSMAFINICYKTRWIARQGRLTMQYYIFHSLIIPPLMAVIAKLNIPMNFLSATIITIGITIGIGISLKLPYVKMLTNPSSFFIKEK